MNILQSVKGFLKMSGHFAGSATYLAEHGYNDEYMNILKKEMENAERIKDRNEGQGLYAQALMFRGKLKEAEEIFAQTDISKLPRLMRSVFVNNYIMCLFLSDKHRQIKDIYREYNKEALSDGSLVMRRTVGIKEYIGKRYENAVTVFIKLVEEPDPRATLMADICLVKAMLALDMTDRAAEIAELGFSRYNGRGDITAEVNRLKMTIKSGGRKNKNNSKKKKK
ncbi:MAG: hypothetical protein NC120_08440 [Ruminococcus sp.]|nr:hypothetical protein [Ruminococcus sp.]